MGFASASHGSYVQEEDQRERSTKKVKDIRVVDSVTHKEEDANARKERATSPTTLVSYQKYSYKELLYMMQKDKKKEKNVLKECM